MNISINGNLQILYDLIVSLGNSLNLNHMVQQFLDTVALKTYLQSGIIVDSLEKNTIATYKKDILLFDIEKDSTIIPKENFKILTLEDEITIVIVVYEEIVMILQYNLLKDEIYKLSKIFLELSQKVNNSVHACVVFKNHKTIKEQLELAIKGSNDGLWDWNIVTNEVYFSPRWKSMIGYEDEEIENQFEEWEKRIHPDDLYITLQSIKEYLFGKSSFFEIVHRLKHKDGSWVWILGRGKAMFDENNNAIRMVGFHTDITLQKELEENLASKVALAVKENQDKDTMLRHQSRLAQLGEMISMIAHQWRQPLAAISSVIVTLKLKVMLRNFEYGTKEDVEKFFNLLNDELDNVEEIILVLTNTIDDFRNFYKPDKKVVQVNVSSPIQKSISLLFAEMRSNNIVLNTQFDSITDINCYENELLQVFLNIIKNSMDAFKEKNCKEPTIDIIAQDFKEYVKITFTDNAGGIDSTIIDKIFDPYFSTKDTKNGTGLGLYMSKMIVEQHHKGKLNVYNSQDGVTFEILLYKIVL